MDFLKNLARLTVYSVRLMIGYVVYLVSKKTPGYGHMSLVGLFCLTHGSSNDALSRAIGAVRRPYRLAKADGVLGDMSASERREPVLAQLRGRGYYVFPKCVPEALCDRLLQFAVSHPCKTRKMDSGGPGGLIQTVYPRSAPEAVRYDFEPQDLLDNQDVQTLLADLSLVALAQSYLGARPVADVLTMWWHTNYSDIPDSEAAQYFHFDMDRPKWLKYFIYLTDVEPANGPHSFIAGSHRTRGIPPHLLRKGYSRLQDAEVAEVFDRHDFIEFAAPRGTIIAEDTRGLHKGKHVEKGDRLVLQIQFSNSLFGALQPRARLGSGLCTELRDRIEQFPGLYALYLRQGAR